jgi:hypothetical protein
VQKIGLFSLSRKHVNQDYKLTLSGRISQLAKPQLETTRPCCRNWSDFTLSKASYACMTYPSPRQHHPQVFQVQLPFISISKIPFLCLESTTEYIAWFCHKMWACCRYRTLESIASYDISESPTTRPQFLSSPTRVYFKDIFPFQSQPEYTAWQSQLASA